MNRKYFIFIILSVFKVKLAQVMCVAQDHSPMRGRAGHRSRGWRSVFAR